MININETMNFLVLWNFPHNNEPVKKHSNYIYAEKQIIKNDTKFNEHSVPDLEWYENSVSWVKYIINSKLPLNFASLDFYPILQIRYFMLFKIQN